VSLSSYLRFVWLPTPWPVPASGQDPLRCPHPPPVQICWLSPSRIRMSCSTSRTAANAPLTAPVFLAQDCQWTTSTAYVSLCIPPRNRIMRRPQYHGRELDVCAVAVVAMHDPLTSLTPRTVYFFKCGHVGRAFEVWGKPLTTGLMRHDVTDIYSFGLGLTKRALCRANAKVTHQHRSFITQRIARTRMLPAATITSGSYRSRTARS